MAFSQYSVKTGFTIIELIIVIAIIGILTGISVPFYNALVAKNEAVVAADITVRSLRRAQMISQASEQDSTWGVKVAAGSITVFKGASYAARDTTYDEDFSISDGITTSGIDEIVYAKLTGLPNVSGNIVFTSVIDETETVRINSKGMVAY